MKKFFCLVIILTLIFNFIIISKTNSQQTNNWLTFQGNNQRTGESNDKISLPLKEVWKLKIGKEDFSGNLVLSSPVYENGIIYVGDNLGYLYSVDAKDGKIIWQTKLTHSINSSPTIGTNNIYVLGSDKYLYAIEKTKGKLVWSKFVGLDKQSPIFHNGNVYVQNSDGSILGFDDKGKEILNYKIISEMNQNFWDSNISEYNNRLYLISAPKGSIYWDDVKGILYCFDLSEKKLIWSKSFQLGVFKALSIYSPPNTTPIIFNNKIWVMSTNGVLNGFDLDSGERYGKAFESISYGNGLVFVNSTPCSSKNMIFLSYDVGLFINMTIIAAFNLDKKEEVWRTPYLDGIIDTSIVTTDNYIFVPVNPSNLSSNSGVLAINKENYRDMRYIWKANNRTRISSIAIGGNKLFFVTSDYHLRCYESECNFEPKIDNNIIEIGTGEEKDVIIKIDFTSDCKLLIKPRVISSDGITAIITPDEITNPGEFLLKLKVDSYLKEGSYDLTIKFESEIETKELKLKVNVFDKTPPNIKLEKDFERFINKNNIKLKIYVEDNQSETDKLKVLYKLDNQDYIEINNLILDLENLSEGEHYLTIKAIDERGNEATSTINFIVDLTPPVIKLNYDKYTNKEKVLISGELEKDGKLYLDGEEILLDDFGKFEKIVDLNEGENKFNFEGIDKAGNKTILDIVIIKDTQTPEVLITLPNETYDESITIMGRVNEKGLSGIKNSIILINQRNVNLSSDNSFTYNMALLEGENKIKIEVEDNAGNKFIKEYTIIRKKRLILTFQIGNNIMYINEISREIDVPPQIIQGRTFLPIRWVAEPLGAEVSWDSNEKKVTITLGDRIIELWIGKNIAKVNGIEKQIDPNNPKVTPIILKGRTLLPLRFVAENLGCSVEWFSDTKTIKITYPGF